MTFCVVKPGVMTLIQDLGRFGYQAQGLTTGGPMDEYAARWANGLLGNDPDAALLEVTLGNLVLTAEHDTVMVVTGADMPLKVNDIAVATWRTIAIRSGDVIALGWARSGQRCYVAVSGGLNLPKEFGSVATVVREKVGGLSGGKLVAGDKIPFQPLSVLQLSQPMKMAPLTAIPNYHQSIQIRVIVGCQFEQFSLADQERFFQSTYTLTADSDRMGFRLSGPALQAAGPVMLSEGIAFGAIQIPPDGQPIIMMKDRQTLGGYPKIGAVLPLDAFRLSQMKTGAQIRFAPVSIVDAQALMAAFGAFFDATQTVLAPPL